MGRSTQYREAVHTRILTDVGLCTDFGDCRVPSHDPKGVAVDFAAVERDVRDSSSHAAPISGRLMRHPCAVRDVRLRIQ